MAVEQYYLFTVPGDELVWCEMFVNVGHFVAPTPYTDMGVALSAMTIARHDATVDTLCLESELDEVRTWARECPLEPLPV
jgi:hypothetical protein